LSDTNPYQKEVLTKVSMHPYQDELIMAEKEVEVRVDDDANINIDLKLTK
jgi:hypothetical protein